MAGEDRLKAVSFAAGTAAFMACIERAVVVSVFVHWRVWVFLALNLLLLAILFTSKSQTSSDEDCQENGANYDSAFKKKKRRQECRPLVLSNCGGEVVEPLKSRGGETVEPPRREGCVMYEMEKVEECGKKEDDHNNDELSKDELNQRAEAFIAMFRQHLVYDAKGKSYHPDQKRVFMTSNQMNSRVCLSHSKNHIDKELTQ